MRRNLAGASLFYERIGPAPAGRYMRELRSISTLDPIATSSLRGGGAHGSERKDHRKKR
jgi:hypothetical protein